MMEFSSVRTLLNDPPNRFNISRKSKSLVITVFLFWFISMPVFIYSERNSYDFEGVRLRIRFLMKRMKTPSISVAVAKDTRIDPKWFCVDPKTGVYYTDATHIKFGRTELDENLFREMVLSASEIIGKLSIRIIKYK